LKIRLYFEDDKKETFMGIGVLWLLKGIQRNGSIRKAAQEMNMSYTKACQILKKLETSLDQIILERQKGGNNRLGTSLTVYGEKFLNSYEQFNNKVEDFCDLEFDKLLTQMESDSF
jgi:molybdate transport system regulatory protein